MKLVYSFCICRRSPTDAKLLHDLIENVIFILCTLFWHQKKTQNHVSFLSLTINNTKVPSNIQHTSTEMGLCAASTKSSLVSFLKYWGSKFVLELDCKWSKLTCRPCLQLYTCLLELFRKGLLNWQTYSWLCESMRQSRQVAVIKGNIIIANPAQQRLWCLYPSRGHSQCPPWKQRSWMSPRKCRWNTNFSDYDEHLPRKSCIFNYIWEYI